MTDRRTTILELLIVVGFCAFLFFYNLGAFGLVGADEPRYAKIAREMVERVRKLVQGVQLSAPFGRYQMALDVAEAIGPR